MKVMTSKTGTVFKLELFLKASVVAETMVVQARMRFVLCFLGQSAHEKPFLKALLMIQCVKNGI